nr:hypothetical protein [Tanacetum cinerariifolium]
RCPPVGFEWNGALADANRSVPLTSSSSEPT